MNKAVLNVALGALVATGAVVHTTDALARTKDASSGGKAGKGSENSVLSDRTFQRLDIQRNTVSNIQFITTNFGIFGLDIEANTGGGYWPRNSGNQYIFGGGVWFGGIKEVRQPDGSLRPRTMAVISYNPNSGLSWMVPGRIDPVKAFPPDGQISIDQSYDDADSVFKYRTYFSTDFDTDGNPVNSDHRFNWPIWHTNPAETLMVNRYFGDYIDDVEKRNKSTYEKGRAVITDEDIFTVFKDTDLSQYEIGREQAFNFGYPLGLEIYNTMYSWANGEYADFMFMKYEIVNRSRDTLRECYMAPAMDMDLAVAGRGSAGAQNDRTRYYFEEPELNLGVQWTNGQFGENGRGFGYIGFNFLESPAVDADGFIRKDKRVFANDEQLGLNTFRNWVIDIDPSNDIERYAFMSEGTLAGDDGPGDKRFLMSTGPFNMAPGDTARVVVGMIFGPAATLVGQQTFPTGDSADIVELVRRVRFAQDVYDNNFRAPKPPDAPFVKWSPLNNGVQVMWDSTSDFSQDILEEGLDFLGYRIYRSRRIDLDTFDVDERSPSLNYPRGRGPYGWKQVAQFQVPFPFVKSARRVDLSNPLSTLIDSLDPSAGRVRRISFNEFEFFRLPTISWGNFWARFTPSQINNFARGYIQIDPARLDSGVNYANIDSIYTFMQSRGVIQALRWGTDSLDFGDRPDVKLFAKQLMDSVSNNRLFIDVGDDNGDGQITETAELATTERIINNIDYYYRVSAYDEGSVFRRTPAKFSPATAGRNIIQSFAYAAPAGPRASIEILPYDTAALGGIYDIAFPIFDADRLSQLYAGDTLELRFNMSGFPGGYLSIASPGATPTQVGAGVYLVEMPLRNVTKNQVITTYDATLGGFGEHGAIAAVFDTTALGRNDSRLIQTRVGGFTSNSPLYGPWRSIYGAFGLTFNHALQQYGGRYRVESVVSKNAAVNAALSANNASTQIFPSVIRLDQTNRTRLLQYGPGTYEVVFSPGGTEDISVATTNRTVNFNVPYLNISVRRVAGYNRPIKNGTVSVDYDYPLNNVTLGNPPYNDQFFTHAGQQTQRTERFPFATLVPADGFNLSAYGWLNGRSSDAPFGANARRLQAANRDDGSPVGQQGRYYLTAVNGADTVDFFHTLLIGGTEVYLDFSDKGGRNSTRITGNSFASQGYKRTTRDFSAGDTAVVDIFGGALGFPRNGTTIRAVVKDGQVTDGNFTDSDLDQIRVVPNPFFVTHFGQASTDDAKLYFTRLPDRCTIKIFTVAGDLVRTIEHDKQRGEDMTNYGVSVWNLLSDGRQRVGSQPFVAHIETPNGAKSIVKFSVIVGGFRNVAR